MDNSENTGQETPATDPVSAITPTEQEVEFINTEVLQPTVTPITGMAKPLADQAAAMMIQDTQSFLQGNEQVLTIAIAKAAALMLNEGTAETGTKALEAYGLVLLGLSGYTAAIGLAATSIVSDFKG